MTRTILALCLLPLAAQAEQPQLTCLPAPAVTAAVARKYGERPSARGVTESGRAQLVVWSNPDTGSWTAAIVGTDGVACLIATGEGWETAKAKVEGRAS